MTTTNENLRRADIAMATFEANGGLLQPEQANTFIDYVLEEPTILKQARVERMNAPEKKISRFGFGTRILRAASQTGGAEDDGTNGRYLKKADRSAPTNTQLTLTSSEVIAEVRLPYEFFEDNLEGQSIEQRIMRGIAAQAAIDLEEFSLWADTTLGVDPLAPEYDAYLGLQDGWMKRVGASHVVDNASAGINPDLFANALIGMPQKYLNRLAQMRAFVSVANRIKYQQKVATRVGGFGDSAVQSDPTKPTFAYGLQVEAAQSMVWNSQSGKGLITFPKNLIFGIRRDITVETDKDIRSREYIIVLTARVGLQVDDIDCSVALKNI
jgi:Phage capsid family.